MGRQLLVNLRICGKSFSEDLEPDLIRVVESLGAITESQRTFADLVLVDEIVLETLGKRRVVDNGKFGISRAIFSQQTPIPQIPLSEALKNTLLKVNWQELPEVGVGFGVTGILCREANHSLHADLDEVIVLEKHLIRFDAID